MYTYHSHNTKHVHLSLSQCKTCTFTTVTIQNMYTYHSHNTKHVHVPLSQHKTCTRTTVTIQNMYTYHCNNTKKYMYRCNNTKHIHILLGTANIKCLLSGYRSAMMFRYLASPKSSNLPTGGTTIRWEPRISHLLLP